MGPWLGWVCLFFRLELPYLLKMAYLPETRILAKQHLLKIYMFFYNYAFY